MEYLYPIGWTVLAVALVIYGANLFRRKCPEEFDPGPTCELLLDAANYFDAECDEEADSLRKRLRDEAKRLGGKP